MRLPFLQAHKSQSYSKQYLDPIKRMVHGIWDVSSSFKLPDSSLFSEAIDTINQVFRKLHDIIVSILISVVALSALTPKLFKIAKEFKENCEFQEENVSLISHAGLRIAEKIENIADHATSLVKDSEIIEKDLQDSLELGEQSIVQVVEIKNFVNELVEIISFLDENSKSIGSIIEVINNISNETSLLSLNARIEAARSGESGKGFAVIAGEIANLASQSQAATDDIHAKLTVLEKKVHETVASVQRVENNVNEGEQVIASSNQALNNVHERFSSFSQKIVDIKAATDDQHQDILKISDDIVAIEDSIKEQASESRTIVEIAEKIKESCDQMIVDTGTFHLSGHQKVKKVAQEIAGQVDIQSMRRDKQEAAMRIALERYDFVELLYITDKIGRQVTSNMYSSQGGVHDVNEGLGHQWADKEWFKEPKKNQIPFVSKVYRSGATGSFCFTVSVPLFDSHKVFSGVLGVDVNFEDMLKIK